MPRFMPTRLLKRNFIKRAKLNKLTIQEVHISLEMAFQMNIKRTAELVIVCGRYSILYMNRN